MKHPNVRKPIPVHIQSIYLLITYLSYMSKETLLVDRCITTHSEQIETAILCCLTVKEQLWVMSFVESWLTISLFGQRPMHDMCLPRIKIMHLWCLHWVQLSMNNRVRSLMKIIHTSADISCIRGRLSILCHILTIPMPKILKTKWFSEDEHNSDEHTLDNMRKYQGQ